MPDTDLAAAAGLAVDDGIVVDERLRTSHPDVFAAGDVARFSAPGARHAHPRRARGQRASPWAAPRAAPWPATRRPTRTCRSSTRTCSSSGYEAVGELDPRGETVADWKDPFREGVVYYLAGGRVRGVLLWNTWDQVDAARALIAEPGPFRASDLAGLLPST